jgi:hypothetical protein
MSTTVHILNHAPTCALNGKTSYEAWHGEVPAVHYFHTFRCIAHLKIKRPNLKKLDDRSRKAIFVEYEDRSKAYHCYVVFDEPVQWCWEDADGDQAGDPKPFTMEYSTEIICDIVLATPSPTPPSTSTPVGEYVEPG